MFDVLHMLWPGALYSALALLLSNSYERDTIECLVSVKQKPHLSLRVAVTLWDRVISIQVNHIAE